MNYYSIDKYSILTPVTVIKIPGIKLECQPNIFAYPQKLAIKKGYGWKLVNGEPKQLIDNRGMLYSTLNGEAINWQQLGEIPAGYTPLKPEVDQRWNGSEWQYSTDYQLNRAYEAKLTEINTLYAEKSQYFYSNVTGKTYRYSTDGEAQLNLTGLVLAGVNSPYICYDGDQRLFIEHTAEQLKQLGLAITAYKAETIGIQAQLLNTLTSLKNTKNIKGIEALAWPTK